jgi:hypothetical protein
MPYAKAANKIKSTMIFKMFSTVIVAFFDIFDFVGLGLFILFIFSFYATGVIDAI